MNQWELIDTAPVPDAGGTMRLMRRGAELVIRVDGRELMSNRVHGSEDALADLVCDQLEKRPDAPAAVRDAAPGARVLIGGLGIGFTLAAALRRLGPEARVTVAELVPAVVRWNQGLLGEAAGHPAKDPRATIYEGDVADLIRRPPRPWDAILLDVDNGPSGLTRTSNDWLYGWQGLDAAFAALRPQGLLGIWSAAPHPAFTRRLQHAGFHVSAIPVRSRGPKGGRRHLVWVCTRLPTRPHAVSGRTKS
jgi:spermidine synthase